MRVLVGCEFSGVVREAFNAYSGVEAYSCDLLPCDDRRPDFHIQGDISKAIRSIGCGMWDLIILHPPCTALAVSGNSTYGTGKTKEHLRAASIDWTWDLWKLANAHSYAVVMENPVGVLSRTLKPSQIIQPYEFGHTEQKKTCLWLRGVPCLTPTNDVYAQMMELPKNERERIHYLPPTKDRWKLRSITYAGIAQAMASQWIAHLIK